MYLRGVRSKNYKIIWEDTPYVLRFYVRDTQLVQVEQEVYHLIHRQVPVPDLLHIGSVKECGPFVN